MIPNEGQGVFDLVNDACGQRTDRGHALRQQQALLQLPLRGHVDDRSDGPLKAAPFAFHESPVHANVSRFTRAGHDRGFEMDVALVAEGSHQHAQEIRFRLGGQQLQRATDALFFARSAD